MDHAVLFEQCVARFDNARFTVDGEREFAGENVGDQEMRIDLAEVKASWLSRIARSSSWRVYWSRYVPQGTAAL